MRLNNSHYSKRGNIISILSYPLYIFTILPYNYFFKEKYNLEKDYKGDFVVNFSSRLDFFLQLPKKFINLFTSKVFSTFSPVNLGIEKDSRVYQGSNNFLPSLGTKKNLSLFLSKSDRDIFAKNLIVVFNAIISFYKHTNGGGFVINGKFCQPNINDIITAKDLIIMLLPSLECRQNAIHAIGSIVFKKGKLIVLSNSSGQVYSSDINTLSSIMNEVVEKHYNAAISVERSIFERRKEEILVNNISPSSSNKVALGLESIVGKDLSHLKNKNCLSYRSR